MVEFRQKLTEILKYYGDTANSIAERINVSPTSICGYVKRDGKATLPKFDMIAEIASLYPDISMEWLMRDSGPMLLSECYLNAAMKGSETNVNIDSNVASGAHSNVSVDQNSELIAYLKAENLRLINEISQKDKRIETLTDRLLDAR